MLVCCKKNLCYFQLILKLAVRMQKFYSQFYIKYAEFILHTVVVAQH